jgi:hypothetical protein
MIDAGENNLVILTLFTAFHVVISLIGIVSGFVVVYGFVTSQGFENWTKTFLATTALTSITGFLFPYEGFKPSYVIGLLSIVILAFAYLGRYRFRLAGGWRRTYVITAVIALYFNFFVLIVQSFRRIPALEALAPTQSEPPFQIAQLVVLLVFIALGYRSVTAFHPSFR